MQRKKVEGLPQTPAQCQAKIDEFTAMANAAIKPEDRLQLDQMAELWRRLYEQAVAANR